MNKYHLSPLPYHSDSSILFNKIVQWPWAIFLDSCQPQGEQGRYDIMSARPYKTVDSFERLKQALEETDFQNIPSLPFSGGALGYFAYDLGLARGEENLIIDMPDMAIGLYDWGIIVDHREKCSWCFAQNTVSKTQWQELLNYLLSSIVIRPPSSRGLLSPLPAACPRDLASPGSRRQAAGRRRGGTEGREGAGEPLKLLSPLKSNMTPSEYISAFKKAKQHIHDGDCYQVNFAQCFSAPVEGDSWQTYQLLRQANPAPYAAFMRIPQGDILSLSPEQFLQVRDGWVQTKPIKGTRPRSQDPETDALLAQQLLASEKDQAENLMIVDLLRNDLGRTCETGSIRVPHLFKLESFTSVHHLVSTITGRLAPKQHSIDLLRHCFPGGSVTGAPKKRAMEIIADLEPQHRSIYCGAMGYINHDGNMETNIVIRTLIVCKNKLYCYAGGGLVADSTVEDEYQETFSKVLRIMQVLTS